MCVLAQTCFHLQNAPRQPGADRAPLDLGLDLFDLGLSGREDRLIHRYIKASVVELLDADRNAWAHAFADPESVLYFCQVGLGLFDLGERRLDLGLEVTTINFKQWIARAHSISPFRIDSGHDSGDWRANGNVLGACLHDARAKDVRGEGRPR